MTRMINKEVEVNSFYFAGSKNFKSYPRQITIGNERYSFKDGLQMLVRRGEEVIRLFDMTDGDMNYKLRNEAGRWTLVCMKTA